jgi:hypothetical protein
MIISSEVDKIEVEPRNWVLAEELIRRLGYTVEDTAQEITVSNLKKATTVLDVWGVPWKWI